jgi:hypothetical protein
MPNCLIQPYVQGIQAAATAVLVDPRYCVEHRARFRRDAIPLLKRANSITVASGRWPTRAWILVPRAQFNAINTYATNLQLQIDDLLHGPLTFQGLTVVQARCVTRGIAADPNAIYLVELTDGRGVVWNEWAQFPTTSAYNVRSPAYPGGYYSGSLNSGSPWTWTALIQNLWTQMGTFLGPFPGLPVTPPNTPENYWFPGTSAWIALCDVLDLFALTVAVNLFSATPYTIVAEGGTDAFNSALVTRYAGQLEDDLEWLDTGSGRVPGSVVVFFHRRNQYYGTEETVRNDSLQWAMTPLYSVTVAAPAQFSAAAGTHYLWDDFTVQFDVNGNPLAADVVTANGIASATAADYYNHIYRGTLGYLWQLYAGPLPFTVGPLFDGVRWRQTHEVDESDQPKLETGLMRDRLVRSAWRTEVTRGPQPPWDELEEHVFGV